MSAEVTQTEGSAPTNIPKDEKLMPTDKKVTPPSQGNVLLKLLLHSMAMFSFPFAAYYFTKQYVEEEYNIPTPRSYIYGAIAAVVIVHVIIVSYVYQAFKEEDQFKKAKELEDKTD